MGMGWSLEGYSSRWGSFGILLHLRVTANSCWRAAEWLWGSDETYLTVRSGPPAVFGVSGLARDTIRVLASPPYASARPCCGSLRPRQLERVYGRQAKRIPREAEELNGRFAGSPRCYRARAIGSSKAIVHTAEFCAKASTGCGGPLFPKVDPEAERTNQQK